MSDNVDFPVCNVDLDDGPQGPPSFITTIQLEELTRKFNKQLEELEARLRAEIARRPSNGAQAAESADEAAKDGQAVVAAEEVEEAEDNDPREYEISESVWDTFLLAGLNMKIGDLVFLCFVIAATVSIQVIFCAIVLESFVESSIDEDGLKDVALWRMITGHKAEYFDDLTNTSLVGRICAGSNFGIMAAAQQGLASDLGGYVWNDGIEAVQSAPALCIIALFFWLLTVAGDMLSTFDFLRAFLTVPKGMASSLEEEDGSLAIKKVSVFRVVVLIFVVVIPRFLIAGILAYAGSMWLIHTHSPGDLILNAVALAFVLDADEMMFAFLVPHRVRDMIGNMSALPVSNRLRIPRRLRQCVPIRATMTFLLVGVGLALAIPLVMKETYLTEEGARILCDGDTDFIYSVDKSTGLVHAATVIAWDDVVPEDQFEEYSFRAVLQKTGLELKNTLKTVTAFEPTITYYDMDTTDSVVTYNDANFHTSNNLLHCTDSVYYDPRIQEISDGPMYEALIASYPTAHACSDLTGPQCEEDTARSICPVQCGCSSGSNGMLRREACPSPCTSLVDLGFTSQWMYWQKAGGCEDVLDKHDEFVRYFRELQALLVEQEGASIRPDGTVFPSDDLVVSFAMYVFFDWYIPRNGTNFDLAAWADLTWNFGANISSLPDCVACPPGPPPAPGDPCLRVHGVDCWNTVDVNPPGMTDSANIIRMESPCRLISFVYKFFGWDACSGDEPFYNGKVGTIREICPYTCGYCDGGVQGSAYQIIGYPDLQDWMTTSMGLTLMTSYQQQRPEQCTIWLEEGYPDLAEDFESYMCWCYPSNSSLYCPAPR